MLHLLFDAIDVSTFGIYLSAHRVLANGAMPGASAEHRVHIVFEGQ